MKGRGHYADPYRPAKDEVKNARNYNSILQHAFMLWCLTKAQGHFYLTLPYLTL
jgi:hypothetical protein